MPSDSCAFISCKPYLAYKLSTSSALRSWSEEIQIFIHKFMRDESGATAIEYGLITALIGVVIIAVRSSAAPASNNGYVPGGISRALYAMKTAPVA